MWLSTRLELPPFNLEFMHRSFTFVVSKLWNALPPMVRESKDTIFSFKRALKGELKPKFNPFLYCSFKKSKTCKITFRWLFVSVAFLFFDNLVSEL